MDNERFLRFLSRQWKTADTVCEGGREGGRVKGAVPAYCITFEQFMTAYFHDGT
ncbi:MAG: hypothetical protein ACHQUC_00270 [Chlamydiales bacterium]